MYEARQNKERVSRVICSSVAQQKENTMIVNRKKELYKHGNLIH